MPNYTEHYNAIKPNEEENYSVDVANTNNDLWDAELYKKQDKIVGKGLSTNDFTNEYKNKLDNIQNYDDTTLKYEINKLKNEKVDKEEGYSLISDEEKAEMQSNITNLQNTQTTQSATIQALQSENTRLKQNQIYGTATGTEVEITDSAEMGASIGASGESEQETRSGKNKLKPTENTSTHNGLSWTITSSQVVISGTATSTYSNSSKIDCNFPVGTYKATSENNNSNISYGVWLYNSQNELIATIKNNAVTINEEAVKYALFIEGITNGQTYNITLKPMVLLSTETDTTYEPYGAMPSSEYPSEIKNLTGDTVCTVTNANIWDEEWANGAMDASTGANQSLAQRIRSKNFISIQPNTDYYFKISNLYSNGRIAYYDKDKNYLGLTNGWRVMAFNGINTSVANAYYMKFNIEIDDSVYHNDICINKSDSSINGTYIQHQEKTITFPFGAQKLAKGDYLASDGIHRVRKQIVFNGTENWQSFTDLGSTVRAFYTYDGVKKDGNIFCNKFTTTTNFELDEEGIGVTPYTSSLFYIKINKSRLSSENLQGFKTFLSECEPVIEYESETEEIIPYTQAQQEAWNELQNILFYEGYNHIEMTSSNGVNANLTINYTKSTKMVINDIEERLSVLEYAGLEG